MTFEGLQNQKICAGEHQPQVTLAKNRKNRNWNMNLYLLLNRRREYSLLIWYYLYVNVKPVYTCVKKVKKHKSC